jgi:hypothetical protein
VTGTEGVFSSSGRVVVNDDEEMGMKMTKAMLNMDMGDENEAATSLSDIEMEEMESVDMFNFAREEGSRERHLKQQRQQDGGREGRANIEWNEEVDSLGVESELPFEVTAWDWSPSLDGGRNSEGYSGEESPVCVTETEHLDESGRFGFFHARLAKGYQICPDFSVRMCDSIGDDGFGDFADHNFKPASIENPLPLLEAVTGYKVKTQKGTLIALTGQIYQRLSFIVWYFCTNYSSVILSTTFSRLTVLTARVLFLTSSLFRGCPIHARCGVAEED